MLFDLFAFFDLSEDKVRCGNPFKDLEPYKKMIFAHQEALSDDAYLVNLHKRHDDNFPVHDDGQYQVRMFGYCFARTDNSYLKDRGRLSANRIAQIYDEYGSDFVQLIKGSFSILIFEKKKKELLIFTDPLNVRPLNYIQRNSQIFVSSSLSAIAHVLRERNVQVVKNYPALIEYHLFGYILNDDTFLKDVSVVPPGASLKFNGAGLQIQRYWDPFKAFGTIEIEHSNEQVAVDKLEAALKKNLDLHLFDPDRTAIALTGGLNSRTNLALLENKAKDFLFYTYGDEKNADVAIAKKITKGLNLRSKSILFDDSFQKGLQKNSDQALGLGDGMAEIKHVYALFAYKEIAKSYDYILTGFFGNELLTPPQLPNFLLRKEMVELLNATDKKQTMDSLLTSLVGSGISESVLEEYGQEATERVLSNPFIVNEEPVAKKYFYFILMVATRKVFMKDVKIEKSFVENLHPFLDIEYIELLLKTPFFWAHTWTGENISKSVWKWDKLYAYLMDRNKPRLNAILSTRGYTPKHLLNSRFNPMMKLEYFYNRKKIAKQENDGFDKEILNYISKDLASGSVKDGIDNQESNGKYPKEDSKREITLRYWFERNNLK